MIPAGMVCKIYAGLPAPEPICTSGVLVSLDQGELSTAISGLDSSISAPLRIMSALFRHTAESPGASEGLDEIYRLLTHGESAGRAALWARALKRHAASELLQMWAPLPSLLQVAAPDRGTSTSCTSEAFKEVFFDALLKANVAATVLHLATGAILDCVGPKILGIDPGCCCWSPLAAACSSSAHRECGVTLAKILILAKADVNATCPGPCGWTPLMRAAYAGSPATCRLLVLAGADVRPRLASSRETALDMAKDVANARAIRAARDERAAMRIVSEAQTSRSKGTGRGVGDKQVARKAPPSAALAALMKAHPEAGKSSGKAGRSGGASTRGSGRSGKGGKGS